MVRREYSVEEKERAVEAVARAGGRVASIARELGVSPSTVGRWVSERKAADRVSAEERERAVQAVAAANGRVGPVAKKLGVAPATVRRWVLERNAVDWAASVSVQFRYLRRRGFRFVGAAADMWEERAIYRSDRSAIEVIKDYQGPRVEVELMRLVDGALPELEVFIVEREPMNRFYVDELIRLRQPDGEAALAQLAKMPTFDEQLKFLAAALRRYGADFLAGDLSVLDELERIVRNRAREHA